MSVACLPNGLIAQAQTPPHQTLQLHEQVLEYFRPRMVVKPGDTVVDVGSNIGLFGLECLTRTQGNLHLICCEPAPPTYEMLKQNLESNFPQSNSLARQIGVSDELGTAKFIYRPLLPAVSSLSAHTPPHMTEHFLNLMKSDDFWNSSYARRIPRFIRWLPTWMTRRMLMAMMKKVASQTVEYDCQLVTLSSLIDELSLQRIDLLKIDVEGAEWSVLNGIRPEHWPLIQQIVAEVHDVENRVARCEQMFRDYGLTEVDTYQEEVFQGSEIYNIFARRPG